MVGLIPATPHAGLMRRYGHGIPDDLQPLRNDLAESMRHSAFQRLDQIVEQAVVRFGGTIVPAATGWGPHETQLVLLGISGTGETLREAAADWAKAARRTAQASEDAA